MLKPLANKTKACFKIGPFKTICILNMCEISTYLFLNVVETRCPTRHASNKSFLNMRCNTMIASDSLVLHGMLYIQSPSLHKAQAVKRRQGHRPLIFPHTLFPESSMQRKYKMLSSSCNAISLKLVY